VIFDADFDASGGNPSLKTKTLEVLYTIFEEMDLCDIWRIRNPSLKHYTWNGVAQGRSTNKEKRLFRRLDYFSSYFGHITTIRRTDKIYTSPIYGPFGCNY
jgi:hypothetical protein